MHLVVLAQDIPHIFAMTLFEEYIYWTDWETKSINRAHKTLGTNKTMLISTLHRPMDVHIYHPYRQPDGRTKIAVINYHVLIFICALVLSDLLCVLLVNTSLLFSGRPPVPDKQWRLQ